MSLNRYSSLKGQHAFLSPSNYHWLRYTPDKLVEIWRNNQAAKRGTEIHDIAAKCIEHGIKLPRTGQTLNMYVNDAIGYRMEPEVTLFYSQVCFGTVDAIGFNRKLLRIHDLKTGITPASMDQLMIYAGLYCLQEHINPFDISFELRIYQNNDVVKAEPSPDEVKDVMDIIVEYSRILEDIIEKEG